MSPQLQEQWQNQPFEGLIRRMSPGVPLAKGDRLLEPEIWGPRISLKAVIFGSFAGAVCCRNRRNIKDPSNRKSMFEFQSIFFPERILLEHRVQNRAIFSLPHCSFEISVWWHKRTTGERMSEPVKRVGFGLPQIALFVFAFSFSICPTASISPNSPTHKK